ncbi:hypothetical protein VNO78_10779 [Psophocarpus tetragonolobus]|uniref:adenylate dimethylallyltransferase (ADP/ATP-dependent) n=1 Tax=Psophocarpus tetragonolobus TaxID=3891 RepID=A0AAN9XN20_PSOTE
MPVFHSYVSQCVDEMLGGGMVGELRPFFKPNGYYSRGIRKAIRVPEFDAYFRRETLVNNETRMRLLNDAVRDVKRNTCLLACKQLGRIHKLRSAPVISKKSIKMTKLTQLIGIIKDKASQSKAVILSKRTTLSLLRATSHDWSTPPTAKHLATLLSSGDGSRATASAAVEVLMDRLQGTNNAAVALKCLMAVHHIIRHGSFILQDQLSVYPSTGGRNYLKLSNFRHSSDPMSWELSWWVRWFAQHVEQLLCASRILGFFLGTSTDREDRVSGLSNTHLLTELDSLLSLVEGICKRPDPNPNGNRLVDEIVNLARGDWGLVQIEVRVRISEFKERLGGLKFGEAVELVCCLKRLEQCQARIVDIMDGAMELRLWDLVRELKEIELYTEEAKLRRETTTLRLIHSSRFSPQLLSSPPHSLRFPSSRFM